MSTKCVLFAETPGGLDTSFVPSTGNLDVFYALSVQSDGKIVVGGRRSPTAPVGVIYRLNTNGQTDPDFRSGAYASSINFSPIPKIDTIFFYTNGNISKVLLGGGFTFYNDGANDVTRSRLARLDSFGRLDTGFTAGANGEVFASAMQSDGKIILCGSFTNFQGSGQNYIARLNSDFTTDTNFNTGTGPGATVRTLALQCDEKILIGGDFTKVNNAGCSRIARLDANGGVDASFSASADGNIYAIAVQTNDNKIVIAGYLQNVNGESHSGIARLNSDGTVDSSFTASCNASAWALAIQRNGKILAGGRFSVGGATKIARFLSNGAIDPDFDPMAGSGTGTSDEVRAIQIQQDGKILVAGKFTTFNNQSRYGIARLYGDPVVPATRPPAITTGLTDQTVSPGTNVTFIVMTDGDPPLNYQWFFNNTLITWATTNSLSITNIQMTNSGTYSVVVTNSAGTNTSLAILRVRPYLTAAILTSNTTIQIMFPWASGQTNILQASTNLLTSNWISIATNQVDGAFTNNFYTDTNRYPQRFFRVLVP